MKAIIKTLVVATVCILGGDARRHLDDTATGRHQQIVTNDHTQLAVTGTQYSPLVEGTDCEVMCLFKDTHNQFCWKFQSPMLTAGYDWQQSQGDRYW